MSEHDDRIDEQEYEEVPPRSIFAATWFRVVLVLIVVGVGGAVAIPYVLDWMNPPPVKPAVTAKAPVPATTPPASPSAAEKNDATVIPAPTSATRAPRTYPFWIALSRGRNGKRLGPCASNSAGSP